MTMTRSHADTIGWHLQQILHHARKAEFVAQNVPQETERALVRQLDNLVRLKVGKEERLRSEPSERVRRNIQDDINLINEAKEDVEKKLAEVRAL